MDAARSTLTGEGAFVGTLHYMSPEQLEGRDTDARSDIFAFGAVLYEMVSGREGLRRPEPGEHHRRGARSAGTEAVRRWRSDRTRLERIVTKCLAKHPDDRWQSARDLGDELRWLSDDVTRPESATSAAGATRGPSAWLTFAAAAIGITVIGVASWGAWERWRTPALPNEILAIRDSSTAG